MIRLSAVAALVALLALFAWRARPRAIDFEPSFEAALERARARGDWVVVHLRRSDRPLCARMDQETLAARAVEAGAREGFVHARVQAEREPALTERLAGPGAALATLVTDERGYVVARLDGFVEARPLADFFERVRARRPAIEAARARLEREPAAVAARLVLADELRALGATVRAEEVAREALATSDDETRPRALALVADLLLARGQEAAAEELRRELLGRYPSPPASDPGTKKE
jgi:tetratricopeptide (TPR) repeat protein